MFFSKMLQFKNFLSLIFLTFCLIFSLSANAQYIWLDSAGQKVFSDLPPPTNTPTHRILQEPKNFLPPNVEASKKTNTEVPAEDNKTPTKLKNNTDLNSENAKKDKNLEEIKKKKDDEEAVKKKMELEAHQKIKTDNCTRAKNAKATLDSGRRLSHTNAKGEYGFMDDATRIVEGKRLDGIIATDCK